VDRSEVTSTLQPLNPPGNSHCIRWQAEWDPRWSKCVGEDKFSSLCREYNYGLKASHITVLSLFIISVQNLVKNYELRGVECDNVLCYDNTIPCFKWNGITKCSRVNSVNYTAEADTGLPARSLGQWEWSSARIPLQHVRTDSIRHWWSESTGY
jgi:hypothetical protein